MKSIFMQARVRYLHLLEEAEEEAAEEEAAVAEEADAVEEAASAAAAVPATEVASAPAVKEAVAAAAPRLVETVPIVRLRPSPPRVVGFGHKLRRDSVCEVCEIAARSSLDGHWIATDCQSCGSVALGALGSYVMTLGWPTRWQVWREDGWWEVRLEARRPAKHGNHMRCASAARSPLGLPFDCTSIATWFPLIVTRLQVRGGLADIRRDRAARDGVSAAPQARLHMRLVSETDDLPNCLLNGLQIRLPIRMLS